MFLVEMRENSRCIAIFRALTCRRDKEKQNRITRVSVVLYTRTFQDSHEYVKIHREVVII